ncbi:MAG: cobalamin-dependent protein [Actinomycetota bacterium]|nr:cobalamin-dependent protein [Actinomycetota bacterium]
MVDDIRDKDSGGKGEGAGGFPTGEAQEELVRSILGMEEERSLALVAEMLEGGADPMEILALCRKAMEKVGEGFEKGELFLPDLIMSGEILSGISDLIKPRIKDDRGPERLGKVLMGTVEGDIHDIGKNIVVFMLDVNGFEVIDLGVDVPPSMFVEKIAELKPDVVGLSCLLTLAYEAMKRTVAAVEEAGLRSDVKIMVGGGTVDDQVREYVGADAYGADAVAAVSLAKGWTGR